MKLSFITLGCKLNQAETEQIKKIFLNKNFEIVPFGSQANIVVIRACAVTMGASQTTREYIRRAKRSGAYVIAGGCLENSQIPEIDFWAKSDTALIKKIEQLVKISTSTKSAKKYTLSQRTRSFVKIQSGCNFNCAYCVIPKYRGKSFSISEAKIIKQITLLEKEGYKEIVLTGVNICQYKDKRADLAQLLNNILKKTNIARVRLGSIDPRLVTDKLIKIYLSNIRLMPHWHLSLQSGSNKILQKMNRGYNKKTYLEIVKKIRKINNKFSFTTDVIVGFPGETNNDFNESIDLVKKVEFAKVHVFPYSPRALTPAQKMPDQIQDKLKKERSKILISTAEQIGNKFKRKFIGQFREVLFENKKTGYWRGYTPEYLPVKYKSANNLSNQIKKIKILPANLE
jgi:threonylcarbamoyladenosine tRNA methylthiotransferase MtaB